MLQLTMNLRTILMTFSLVIIGFCITLYFQSESTIDSINLEQYKILPYNESRSHTLSELNAKITPYHLEDLISEIYEKNKLAGEKTRVMEIGFGNGRVLMELKKLFPEVEFYGINKEKTHTFYRRESFILTALKFNLMNKDEAHDMILPYVVFEDLDYGKKIPYAENKFDLIYSQGTVPFIRYTFELFTDILRVLKLDGISVHTDVTGVNIFSKGVMLSFKEAMREIRRQGIEIYVLDNPQSIRFKKSSFNVGFPLTPHQAIPEKIENLSQEQSRPEMSYNLNF